MASNTGVLADAKVAFSLDSPVSWNKVENLNDLVIPTLVADDVDTGVYGIRFKRTIPGLKTVNDMTMKFLRDHSSITAPNQNALFEHNDNGTQLWWRIEVHADEDASVDSWEAYEFEGRVGSFEPAAPFGDKQTLQAVVKFNGTSYTRYAPAASQIS